MTIFFRYLAVCLTLFSFSACGILEEKFSRKQNGATTEVRFSSPKDLSPLVAQSGGVMIYFIQEPGEGGVAALFTSDSQAMGSSVAIPNGSYRVMAMGFDGTGIGEGQARCGWGNNAGILSLTGGSITVTITLSAANCSFGTNTEFGKLENADSTGTNFKAWTIKACSEANPVIGTCTDPGTVGSVRISVLAGTDPTGNSFFEDAARNLVSNCYVYSAGSASTLFKFPFGSNVQNGLTAPIRVEAFAGGSCSGAPLRTWNFINNGVVDYHNATTQPYSLDLPDPGGMGTLLLSY